MLLLTVVIILRIASPSTANLSYLVLGLYALAGRTQAINALAMSFLFSMLSPAIAPEASMASVGRYAVISASALSVFMRAGWIHGFAFRVSYPTLATLVLGLFLTGHSILISPIVDVSVLKAINWTVAAATLFAAWGGLNNEARSRAAENIFAGLVVILVLSLPLLAIPAIGYMRNGTGFQGIFNHPQAFGATIALLGAWAGARMLNESRPQWRWVFLTCVCSILVVLTEARTGGLGMVLGIMVAATLLPMLSRLPIRVILPGITSRRFYFFIGFASLCALLAGTALIDRIGDFFIKRSDGLFSFGQIYEHSRGEQISNMMDNIEKRPLTGIGFGISSQPDLMAVDRDSILGLPTSASIEKGVFPIAVVEEVGIFGALAIFFWIWMLLSRASRADINALTVVLTTLLLNLGENTFFSPGGFGLLPLILITWAATARPIRARR